jgi:hypothetical protein
MNARFPFRSIFLAVPGLFYIFCLPDQRPFHSFIHSSNSFVMRWLRYSTRSPAYVTIRYSRVQYGLLSLTLSKVTEGTSFTTYRAEKVFKLKFSKNRPKCKIDLSRLNQVRVRCIAPTRLSQNRPNSEHQNTEHNIINIRNSTDYNCTFTVIWFGFWSSRLYHTYNIQQRTNSIQQRTYNIIQNTVLYSRPRCPSPPIAASYQSSRPQRLCWWGTLLLW